MLTVRLAPSPAARIVARSALVVALLATGPSAATSQPTEAGASAAMRRLTEGQYRNAIADIFGPDIQFAGRMDPLVRPPHGLQVAGVSQISVSAAGLEQYVRHKVKMELPTFSPCPPEVTSGFTRRYCDCGIGPASGHYGRCGPTLNAKH